MSSYKPKRHEWAIKVQENCAMPIYRQIWTGCQIEEVDKIGMNGNDFAKRRDFSGLDKIILLHGNEIHLAQRFRGYEPIEKRYSKGYDFSLRYNTPGLIGTKEAEYFKLVEAIKTDVWFPNKYIWGVTKTDDPKSGFEILNIYNVRKMMTAIINKEVKPIGVYPNGDGSSGIYFKLNDLVPFIEWKLPEAQQKIVVVNKNTPKHQATFNSFFC